MTASSAISATSASPTSAHLCNSLSAPATFATSASARQLQRKRCAATAAGHSAQRILSDFICICNDGNDSFSCSVSERQFDDSGHCASASVSMFGIGDNTAALAFGDINSVSFSVQQQPLRRRASDGSNIFGFSFQCCSSFSSSVSRSSMSATTCAAASAVWRQHQLWRATSTSTALTCSSASALSPAAGSAQLEIQHHQHLRSSSTAAQHQRSVAVTARAFAAASFSSAPVCVFVSTSVEQQRTFQQQHTSRSQLSDQRHAPRLHFSFGV